MNSTPTSGRAVVVLAAGKGKRMKSDLPKVLHEIDGRPLIAILMDTLTRMQFDRIVVVIGHKGEMVQQALKDYPVDFVWQREQLGTGHAVQMAEPLLKDFEGTTIVCNGDVPYLSESSLSKLLEVHERTGAAGTCLSAIFEDPTGYGRIIRAQGGDFIESIIEHKDASDEILKIKEGNTGTFAFDNQKLLGVLGEIKADNAQQEYYLPDAVKILNAKGLKIAVVPADNPDEVLGVNDKEQLEELAEKFNQR